MVLFPYYHVPLDGLTGLFHSHSNKTEVLCYAKVNFLLDSWWSCWACGCSCSWERLVNSEGGCTMTADFWVMLLFIVLLQGIIDMSSE